MKLDTFRRLDSHDRRIRQLERVEAPYTRPDEQVYLSALSSPVTLTGTFQDVTTTELFWPDEWESTHVYVTGAAYLDATVAPAGLEWRLRAGAATGTTRGGTPAKTSGDVVAFEWFFDVFENPVTVALAARKTSGTGTVVARSPIVGYRAINPTVLEGV